MPFSPDSINVNTGAKATILGNGFFTNITGICSLKVIAKPFVYVGRFLILHNGEIKLLVISKFVSSGGGLGLAANAGKLAFIIPISGKPLTKGLDGLVRAGDPSAPTYWKTGTLIAQGLQDKSTGKLITTNNSI